MIIVLDVCQNHCCLFKPELLSIARKLKQQQQQQQQKSYLLQVTYVTYYVSGLFAANITS